MFGANLGNIILKSTAANGTITHETVHFIATKHINNNTLIVKLANVDPNDIVVQAQIQGSTTSSEGVVYILTAGPGINPSTVRNTIDNPNAVSIVTKPVSATDGKFSITVPSWSVVVVTLAL